MPGRPVPGCWRTPCMGATYSCAACWRHGSSPTCSRCAPTTACASGPRRGWRRPTPRRWPMPWRGMPGPTHAAGEGAKGLRLYEWARIAPSSREDRGFEHWLLIRRSRREADKRGSYFAVAPGGVSLGELAGAAGLRWTIEECFERAKDDLGLDHCEARSWHGWHRHMSLCLAAAAFLARLAADLRRATWGKANERSPVVPAAA